MRREAHVVELLREEMGDERHVLVSALGTDPAFDDDVGIHDT